MKYFFSIFLMLLASLVLALDFDNEFGFSPEFSLNKKINDSWKLSTKIESFYIDRSSNNENSWEKYHDGTDMQFFISSRINPSHSAALGYQLGYNPEGKNSHRFNQQYAIVQRLNAMKLAHRLRADQTFYSDKATKYRLRYRISAEFPLQGQAIDPYEFYLVTSNELLFALQNESTALENRVVVNLGYFFANRNKIQAGLDLRSDLSTSPAKNTTWFKMGWYINI